MRLYTFNSGCVPFKGSFKGECTMDWVKDNSYDDRWVLGTDLELVRYWAPVPLESQNPFRLVL